MGWPRKSLAPRRAARQADAPVRPSPRLAAVLILIALIGAGCSAAEPRAKDLENHSGEDMDMERPTIERHPDGSFTVGAKFQWRHGCGERKVPCWFKDGDDHGGPDVFGAHISDPVTVRDATFTLVSNCGQRRVLRDWVRLDDGVAFIAQDESRAAGKSCEGSPGREYNWDSGSVVFDFDLAVPCDVQLVGADAMFGHSWGKTDGNVSVNQGNIDWGGDASDQFTVIPNGAGAYSCPKAETLRD